MASGHAESAGQNTPRALLSSRAEKMKTETSHRLARSLIVAGGIITIAATGATAYETFSGQLNEKWPYVYGTAASVGVAIYAVGINHRNRSDNSDDLRVCLW